jgi:lipopolysaccharide biosynthesis regulator YciM
MESRINFCKIILKIKSTTTHSEIVGFACEIAKRINKAEEARNVISNVHKAIRRKHFLKDCMEFMVR